MQQPLSPEPAENWAEKSPFFLGGRGFIVCAIMEPMRLPLNRPQRPYVNTGGRHWLLRAIWKNRTVQTFLSSRPGGWDLFGLLYILPRFFKGSRQKR